MNDQSALQAIADALNKTPQQINMGLSLIGAIIFVFLLIVLTISLIRRYKLFTIYKEKYLQQLAACNLSFLEIDIIDKLSQYLKTPQKKYLLLVNSHIFNSCLQEYEKTNPLAPDFIKELCKKLGFKLVDLFHFPVATWDIQEGKPAVLQFMDKKNITGVITKQLADALVFKIGDNSSAPLPGMDATIYMHYSLGVYYFHTMVQTIEDKNVYVNHSDTITKMQRREYFRKALSLPVIIQKEGSLEKPVASVIVDLSMGGMSVRNPHNQFQKGDDCKLYFHDEANANFHLYGEVIRTSKNGKIMHIRFGHLPASVEVQINNFLKI